MNSKKPKEPKDTVCGHGQSRRFNSKSSCIQRELFRLANKTLNVLATHSFSRLNLLLFELEIFRLDFIAKIFLYIHF